MPVILTKEAEKAWINADTDIQTLKSLLNPYPAELMESYEVSTIVNSPLKFNAFIRKLHSVQVGKKRKTG